jgi:hypothetical protein
MRRNPFRKLNWLTGSFLVLLLIVPATRWLVIQQAQRLYSPFPWVADQLGVCRSPSEQIALQTEFHARMEAATDPSDVRAQIALSTLRVTSRQGRDGGHTLVQKFPDQLSARAAMLRGMCRGAGPLSGRTEPALLRGSDPTLTDRKPPSWESLDALIREAEAGERLDPHNAFFPLVKAAGLFGQRRDDEALEALARAARSSYYEDYMVDELVGWATLIRSGYGDRSALTSLFASSQVWLPQLPAFRHLAEIAVYKAVGYERAGDHKAGWQVRKAVMACGELMRTQGKMVNVNTCGMRMVELATFRPAGADLNPPKDHENPVTLARGARAAFLANLGRVAGKAEAERAAHLLDRTEWTRQWLSKATDEQLPGPSAVPLILWWLVGMALLANATFMAGLALIAARSLRLPSVRAGRPLDRAVATGILCGFAVVIGLVCLCGAVEGIDWFGRFTHYEAWGAAWMRMAVLGAIPLSVCGVLLGLAARRRTGRFATSLCVSTMVSGISLLAGAAVLLGVARPGVDLAMVGVQISGPVYQCLGWSPPPYILTMGRLHGLWPLLIVAFPVASALVFGATSLLCRVPLTVGLVRGFRGLGMPVACMLLVAYAVTTPFTALEEARLSARLNKYNRNEIAFLAKRVGVRWPGELPAQVAAGPADGQCR